MFKSEPPAENKWIAIVSNIQETERITFSSNIMGWSIYNKLGETDVCNPVIYLVFFSLFLFCFCTYSYTLEYMYLWRMQQNKKIFFKKDKN